MKELTINQMENINGTGFWGGFCVGMAALSVGAGVAAATNFWNPVGWAGGVLLAADAGCLILAATQLDQRTALNPFE